MGDSPRSLMATLLLVADVRRIVPGTTLAFDDTDSPEGMCTTYLATLMLDELRDYDLIGLPRLVRLNPNVPWKTRGNAAVSIQLGTGTGREAVCGHIGGRTIKYFRSGTLVDPEQLLARAAEVLESNARFEYHSTNPGILCTLNRPPPSLYWKAVREIVRLEDVETILRGCGAKWKVYKGGRGLIGAAAAAAWRPRDRTWEVITYRHPSMLGKERVIDDASVIVMDKSVASTFNNYDPENGHVAIVPGSPCPVLYGIRGDSQSDLLLASDMIRGEKPERWLMYLSNQGTEDHIVRKRIRQLRPGDSVKVEARVTTMPVTIPGGHVVIRISDGSEIDAAFYEPSKSFRAVARSLIPGDEVVAFGSVRSSPRTLNIEKLQITNLSRDVKKVRNPACVKCGKSMGSMGRGQGFRCKKCGSRAPDSSSVKVEEPRRLALGWYEPPISSRRHLHKPIRRMSKGTINKI